MRPYDGSGEYVRSAVVKEGDEIRFPEIRFPGDEYLTVTEVLPFRKGSEIQITAAASYTFRCPAESPVLRRVVDV